MLARMPPRRKRLQQTHPLRLWREHVGQSQSTVAAACGMTQEMVSLIELGLRVPQGENLDRLLAYTGLPTDAFVRTERFLEEQPDFFQKYARREKGRARKPRDK
jgi:transcriptional regulator with XRE-family HTH domain